MNVPLIMGVVGVGMLLFARLHDPRGWRRAWLKAYGNVRFGLRVCGLMVAAGAVVVAWWSRPVVEALAVRVHRRQEAR